MLLNEGPAGRRRDRRSPARTRVRVARDGARRAMRAPCRWRCGATRSPPRPRWCSRSSAIARERGAALVGTVGKLAVRRRRRDQRDSRPTSSSPSTCARARTRGAPRARRDRGRVPTRSPRAATWRSSGRRCYELAAAPCDAGTAGRARRARSHAHGLPVRRLPSGAGHDAMEFSAVCPIAMLFVRCGNGGISHNPRETHDGRGRRGRDRGAARFPRALLARPNAHDGAIDDRWLVDAHHDAAGRLPRASS